MAAGSVVELAFRVAKGELKVRLGIFQVVSKTPPNERKDKKNPSVRLHFENHQLKHRALA